MPPALPQPKIDPGPVLFAIPGIEIFADHVCASGRLRSMSEIVSVRGSERFETFNLVTFAHHSGLAITFSDGEVASLSEDRAWFAGKRHDQINMAYAHLQRQTLPTRAANLAKRLSRERELTLHQPILNESHVLLSIDGTVTMGDRTVSLKVAQERGTLLIGTGWVSLNGMNQRTDPTEIVLSESKPRLGFLVPGSAIRFHSTVHDFDAVHALLTWLLEPGNSL